MKEEKYIQMYECVKDTRHLSSTVKALHDILPMIMLFFYPLQLLYLVFTVGFGNEVFLKALIVPLGVLIFVTLLRIIINEKRPYEQFDCTPLVQKKSKGHSFPSRHTASAFIIAMAFLYIQPSIGVLMLIMATIIGITRVLSGVHFVKDVIGGALISIITGIICFFLI